MNTRAPMTPAQLNARFAPVTEIAKLTTDAPELEDLHYEIAATATKWMADAKKGKMVTGQEIVQKIREWMKIINPHRERIDGVIERNKAKLGEKEKAEGSKDHSKKPKGKSMGGAAG